MKKNPPKSNEENGEVLEFPIAPDFVSKTPQIDPKAMLERSAQNMPWNKKRPGEAERRAAEKIDVEFVL